MIIFGMIKRQKKTAFYGGHLLYGMLKEEFERDALDSDRTAQGGALKWCGGTYVATTEAKQQQHPSGATARESTLECRERRPNGTCDVHFSAHTVPRARDMQPMPDRRP